MGKICTSTVAVVHFIVFSLKIAETRILSQVAYYHTVCVLSIDLQKRSPCEAFSAFSFSARAAQLTKNTQKIQKKSLHNGGILLYNVVNEKRLFEWRKL